MLSKIQEKWYTWQSKFFTAVKEQTLLLGGIPFHFRVQGHILLPPLPSRTKLHWYSPLFSASQKIWRKPGNGARRSTKEEWTEQSPRQWTKAAQDVLVNVLRRLSEDTVDMNSFGNPTGRPPVISKRMHQHFHLLLAWHPSQERQEESDQKGESYIHAVQSQTSLAIYIFLKSAWAGNVVLFPTILQNTTLIIDADSPSNL